MERKRLVTGLALVLAALLFPAGRAEAKEPETIYNSSYVSFSPDGKAWTTNAGDTDYTWYDGDVAHTGIASSVRAVNAGEHYYSYRRTGTIPVGYWQVEHQHGHCVHNAYPGAEWESLWHGVPVKRNLCGGYYYSGWVAYCADCGERLTQLVYMSKEAAYSIDYLDIGDMFYYYCCPWCENFEQGVGLTEHSCKEISWNRYKVKYDPNAGNASGYMSDSIHMYNNATVYNGEPVTPLTHLSKNTYTRVGYEFTGWNTRPDGRGTSFMDGAEILNLTTEDDGVVTLYAQWKPSVSTLAIDPAGGLYNGRPGVSTVTGSYLSRYLADSGNLTPPAGHTVSFETNGGGYIAPVTGTRHFTEWSMEQPFRGDFYNSWYTFLAPQGNRDTIRANYQADPIILPAPTKPGSSFGGWYYDPGFTDPAGKPGDPLTPDRDMTLYAQWAELVLRSEDNYHANGGRGAVDLSWFQPDGLNKTYLLYQSRDGGRHWTQVCAANDISNSRSVEESFGYSGAPGSYTVPYTGIYMLTAEGAQGGGYGSHSGGLGGTVSGSFFLQAGEVITYNIGGQGGYNGGGTGDPSVGAVGGGCTVVSSSLKGTLLIAGGGGGATAKADGGPGGSSASVLPGASTLGAPGASGGAGGGGGYEGGTAGAVIPEVTGKKLMPLELPAGSHVTVTFKKYEKTEANEGCNHMWAEWKYRIDDDYLITEENPDWTADDYVYIRGKAYFVIGSTANVWTAPEASPNSYDALYCGDKPGSFGMFFYGVSDFHHGVESEEHANGHYLLGDIVDVVIQEASASPAYGGSSFVNAAFASSYGGDPGKHSGDGAVGIRSERVGFVDGLSLGGVTATDYAAPDAVAAEGVRKEALGGSSVSLSWEAPGDNGTPYHHRAESYLAGTASLLCNSNVTVNTLVSGVAGYYVLVDGNGGTAATAGNGSFTAAPAWTASLSDAVQYLHVAAVDRAGNLGPTSHIPLGLADPALKWPLYTRPLTVEEGENVYRAGNGAVYVRSDGETPFTLHYGAYMDGRARDDYQINYAVFESTALGETARNTVRFDSRPVAAVEMRVTASDYAVEAAGEPLLAIYPSTRAFRTEGWAGLSAAQSFTLDPGADGVTIGLVPVAGADFQGGIVYSDYSADRLNGTSIIGDGTPPVINGLEALEGRELLDRRDGDVTLLCTAWDALSGVRDFYVEIYNTDNAMHKVYRPDASGSIKIGITEDEPIFSGDFNVTACAVDNVGNVSYAGAGATEFSLETSIQRMLEPHDPVFKRGESGILTITTWGYADRVEVEFPQELLELDPELNRTYVYTDKPAYRHEEELEFMIPLYAPEDAAYTVTVRAYKGDKQLEDYPSLSVISVSGTILDELRWRLR